MIKQSLQPTDSERDRPVIDMTPAMVSAGGKAFLAWFEQPHLSEELVSLPSSEDVGALCSEIFASMIRERPMV